jgi:hypothetical protein
MKREWREKRKSGRVEKGGRRGYLANIPGSHPMISAGFHLVIVLGERRERREKGRRGGREEEEGKRREKEYLANILGSHPIISAGLQSVIVLSNTKR